MSQPDQDWLSKPWVYSKPNGEEALAKWKEKWTTVLLDYAENKNICVVNVSDLKRESPFNKIDSESFSHLLDHWVCTKHAKWRNKQAKLLAICWRSLDKWAELVVQAAKEKGTTIINGSDGLLELYPSAASLPQDELEQLLKLIVYKKYGRFIDKKKFVIKIA